MHFVYILKSINYAKTYVGHTSNLSRRFEEHNAGYRNYSSLYKPWKLIYSEEYSTLELARKREKYLKSATGRKFMKRIIPE